MLQPSTPGVVFATTAMLLPAIARPANLVTNSSFETGLQGWGCYTRGAGGYPYDVRLVQQDPLPERAESADAPDGRYVLRFDAPEHCSFTTCSRAFEVQPGEYALRLSARTAMPVTVRLVDSGKERDNTLAAVEAQPGEGWQELTSEASVTDETTQVAISISGQGPGRLALDALRLTRDGDSVPDMPAEVGVEVSAPAGVYMAGDGKGVTLRVYAVEECSGRLGYRVENAWGDEVATGEVKVSLNAGSLHEERVPLDLDMTGHYRVLAQLRDGPNALSYPAEALLAVIPDRAVPTSTEGAEQSRFGCNMDNRPWLMQIARKIGMRWVFCAPPLFTKWFSAEPRPGDWQAYHELVDAFAASGLRLVGNLADPPYWATNPGDQRYSGPWPNPNLPTDWDQWEAYVKWVVQEYYPQIADWGVWNEPNHPGYLRLDEGEEWPTKYLTLLQHTYEPAKSVAPDVRIVGGTVTNPGALPALIAAGGLQWMDVAAFHWSSWSPDGYLRNTGEEVGFLGPKDKSVNCIERITDAYAAAGGSAPLWDTECHLTEADLEREFVTQPDPPKAHKTDTMTALDAAAAVPRQYITEWAAGIGRTFAWLLAPYSSSWQPRTAITMLEWERSPAAALVAYAVMTDILHDAEFVDWKMETDQNSIDRPIFWTFRFRKPNGNLRVIWGNRDGEHEVTLDVAGDNVVVRDMFGAMREGVRSMSGVELKDKIVLPVGRYPYYVFEEG